jgi:CRISPR-associated protein Cmr2
MSDWLVEISFGPVHGFIAAARRSRDLWAGSRILSEVVRAGAKSLIADGAVLIYPTQAAVDAVDMPGNMSNTILAMISCSEDGKQLDDTALLQRQQTFLSEMVGRAQQAGRDALVGISVDERKKWHDALYPEQPRTSLWEKQVENVIDSYAAWSIFKPESGYKPAYQALKAAFAQRKNTRDFKPHAMAEAYPDKGIPKSALDGVNESVLPETRQRAINRFDLGEGEQLDAIGCMKRSYGKQEYFTALTRLAADAWLKTLDDSVLKALRVAYEDLVDLDFATRTSGNNDCYRDFPYDAGLLFGGALKEATTRAGKDGNVKAYSALCAVAKVMDGIGTRPNPYVALLVADGDRMGAFIDKAETQVQHASISEAIALFSNQVPALARDDRGHAIFHGGEDLMVAYPLLSAVNGAHALSRAFKRAVAGVIEALMPDEASRAGGVPTLRAGLAICHVMEPLGFIRRAADDAEKYAKGDAGTAQQGDALGIHLHLRSGPRLDARFRFGTVGRPGLDFLAFQRWMKAYSENSRLFSGRVAFDIRDLAGANDTLRRNTTAPDEIALAEKITVNAFERVLERAQKSGGNTKMDLRLKHRLRRRLQTLQASHDGSIAAACTALGNELVLARWMSAVDRRSLHETGDRA